MVPHASSPGLGRGRRPASCSSSQRILVAEKYGSRTRPVRSVDPGLVGSGARRQKSAVRRSCQTMARPDGPAAGALPEHDGLALVGQADGGQARGSTPAAASACGTTAATAPPDLLGVVLDPARPRVVLRQFLGRAAERTAGDVVDHGPRAGRALVDGKYIGERHGINPPPVDRAAGRDCTGLEIHQVLSVSHRPPMCGTHRILTFPPDGGNRRAGTKKEEGLIATPRPFRK